MAVIAFIEGLDQRISRAAESSFDLVVRDASSTDHVDCSTE
jgi:hypothetical protein